MASGGSCKCARDQKIDEKRGIHWRRDSTWTGVGTAIGVALDNTALGIAIGAGVGLVFALAFMKSGKRDDNDSS